MPTRLDIQKTERAHIPPVTTIDKAHAAMVSGGESEILAFYRTVLGSGLYVVSDPQRSQEGPRPRVFPVRGSKVVMVFDLKQRVIQVGGTKLASFVIDGHRLFRELCGRGIGIALNLENAPSATLIDGETVDWVCREFGLGTDVRAPALESAPMKAEIKALLAPRNFPDSLLLELEQAIAPFARHYADAILLKVDYEDGKSGFFIAFTGAEETEFQSLVNTVEKALAARPRHDILLDVTFLSRDDPALDRLRKIGLLLSSGPAAPLRLGASDRVD